MGSILLTAYKYTLFFLNFVGNFSTSHIIRYIVKT